MVLGPSQAYKFAAKVLADGDSQAAGEGSGNLSGTTGGGVVCMVCGERESQYTCPRCNARYCCVNCFQKHGGRCTEGFYKEQILDELQSRPVSNEMERKEMVAILKRMREEELQPRHGHGEAQEVPKEEGDTLSRALGDLVLSEETDWADLTPEQQRAFAKAAAQGELSSLVEVWDPWWLHTGMVASLDAKGGEEVDEEEEKEEGISHRPPRIVDNLPALSTLTKKAPSELLAFSLVDVLWSYARCQRWCNGEACADPSLCLDAAQALIAYSPSLSQALPSQSVAATMHACHARAASLGTASAAPEGSLLASDTSHLCRSRMVALAALSECREMLLAARRQEGARRKGLDMGEKKLWFMLSWCAEQPPDMFRSLSEACRQAAEEEEARETERASARPVKAADVGGESSDGGRRGKPLVEELS